MSSDALNIEDYGLIGDCRTAALVSKHGSIDWCCFPDFDSPSLFAAILDQVRGGFFQIAPDVAFDSEQSYLTDTNVLFTLFQTPRGRVRLVDTFAVCSEHEQKKRLSPQHEILRIIEGVSGEVEMRLAFTPKPNYGLDTLDLEYRPKFGIIASYGKHLVILRWDFPESRGMRLEFAGSDRSQAEITFRVSVGQRYSVSLSYSDEAPAVFVPLGEAAWERLEQTKRYWKKWVSQCQYDGPYSDHVRRSALTLKLLTFAPSGAVVAAPTTSLPEKIGGNRNWDYRYCWLRDAAFTARAFVSLGYLDEAKSYVSWLLHATRLTWPRLQVLYSIYGEPTLPEKVLSHFDGYRGSKPVRIGNAADHQFQLDVYGEVVDALHAVSPHLGKLDRDTKLFLRGIGRSIELLWKMPDDGIWEVRSGVAQHTHSKVLAWVALDRLLKLDEKFDLKLPRLKYEKLAQTIHDWVEDEGYNQRLKAYTRTLGGDDLDSSLLVLGILGFTDASSFRMIQTCKAICKKLSRKGFLYRYSDKTLDGLPAGEGAFGLCSFWLAENLAKSGQLSEARRWFESVLSRKNALELWSEEIDPDTGVFLGNYPQAFSHIGLINAAITLDSALKKESLDRRRVA